MTTDQTQAIAAEIRQAVAFGKQAVIRELVDAIAEERREARWGHAVPYSVRSDAQKRAYRAGEDDGLDAAARIIRNHQIEGEPKP